MPDPEDARLLVYGAYGYTGRLVVDAALDRGYEPIIAGRDATKTRGVAAANDLQARTFPVTDADAYLGDVHAVLNCAGPFAETADAMADACIETETHYLDVTGELAVFERVRRRGIDAGDAGVTLLPGVGFDVVPTDCLAVHLHDRLPDATHLSLALDADGGVSPGTLKTVLSDVGSGGTVRREGDLRAEQIGARTRAVDFGDGLRRAVSVPWGDVSTAYHTTEIPNIDVYLALPAAARRAVSRLRTPEPYRFTAAAASLLAEKVLDGDAPTGYQTPASAFGPDLVFEFSGVERVDLADGEVVDRTSTAAA